MPLQHNSTTPSELLKQLVPLLAPNSHILDLACGSGRNGLWLESQGYNVTYLDKNSEALAGIVEKNHQAKIIEADLESNTPYQLAESAYDAIIVFRYLHRPLMQKLVKALKPGGILVYETFTHQQATIGRPKNPNFLLQDNELPQTFPMLTTHLHQQHFYQQAYIAQYIGIN